MVVKTRFALVVLAGAVVCFCQERVTGEWRAPITVVADDHFSQGANHISYFMRVGAHQVEVHFNGAASSLISGQIVRVRGTLTGTELAGALIDAVPAPSDASTCSTTGEQKIAILMLAFPGVPFPTNIIAPADLHDMYFSLNRVSVDGYLRDASYGQTFATGDVFGPFMLDQYYDFQTEQAQGQDAAIRAADSTVDFSVYNHVVFVWPAPGVSGWGGRAVVGCSVLNSPSKGQIAGTYVVLGVGTAQPYQGMVGLAAHEEGHNLGLNHASSLDYAPQVLGPPGVDGIHQEYGDLFSMMGGGEGQLLLGHFASPHKSKLGWLDSASIQNVETAGSFILQPYENSSGTRALRVQRGLSSNEWLWLEYRQPIGYDASLGPPSAQGFSGALIHYEDPSEEPNHTLLLDFTPNTPHDFSDPALAAGQSWSDPYSPLSISVGIPTAAGLPVSVSYRSACTTLNPTSASHGAGAETGSFAVTGAAGCTWSASSTVSWISITSGANGMGSGRVNYALQANSTQAARTGYIFVGFQAVTITQATSFVNQPPSFESVAPSSGTGLSQAFTFFVSDPNGAGNLAHIDVDFVKTGFICQVGYTMTNGQLYLLNDNLTAEIGPVIAGVNLALQNSECALDASAVTVTSSGNSMQLTFPMIFMRPGLWSVQVNLYNASKSHIFAFAGSWTTPQTSCSFTLAPASLTVGMNETAGSIALAADPGCPWMASGTPPWLRITSALRGSGGGAVSYDIAANPYGTPRNGTITIGGKNIFVSQGVSAGALPVITNVLNGASFLAGLSSSTWITIQGTNLGPGARSWTTSDFAGNRLPTQLGGVSVTINGFPAFIYYVSPTQLNVLAADDVTIGPVQVEVDTPDGRSASFTVQKQQLSPALFLFDQGGHKYAAGVHTDGSYVGSANLIPGAVSRPAAPGDVILLFGTGFGVTNPVAATATLLAQPAPLSAPVTIRIGGVAADVSFAGLVASGECQFNVTVPEVPPGDQTVVAEIGGVTSQGNVFLTVGR
jgi:uncharacterized protein (TIGR03437 family)